MAFGLILGSLLGPAITGLFRGSPSGAALGASQALYENATNIDEISTLAQRRITDHQSQAFNDSVMHDTEEAKESNMIQTFMVSVAGADKTVMEKLIGTVSS